MWGEALRLAETEEAKPDSHSTTIAEPDFDPLDRCTGAGEPDSEHSEVDMNPVKSGHPVGASWAGVDPWDGQV
jgi:hypothetical protein